MQKQADQAVRCRLKAQKDLGAWFFLEIQPLRNVLSPGAVRVKLTRRLRWAYATDIVFSQRHLPLR